MQVGRRFRQTYFNKDAEIKIRKKVSGTFFSDKGTYAYFSIRTIAGTAWKTAITAPGNLYCPVLYRAESLVILQLQNSCRERFHVLTSYKRYASLTFFHGVLAFIPQKSNTFAPHLKGKMLEWFKRHAWKACSRQNWHGGSNPPLSACNRLFSPCFIGFRLSVFVSFCCFLLLFVAKCVQYVCSYFLEK